MEWPEWPTQPYQIAWVWTDSTGFQELGEGTASDINNNGDIIGFPFSLLTPWIRLGGGPPQLLPLSQTPADSGAIIEAINDNREIVGATYPPRVPLRWSSPTSIPISMSPLGQGIGHAYGINSAGISIGDGNGFAIRWDPTGAGEALPVPYSGQYGNARGINSVGQIGGFNGAYTGMRWEPDGQTYTQIGQYLKLNAINDEGHLVGYHELADRAFVWTQESGVIWLGPETVDSEATDINNNGDIVGWVRSETGPPWWSAVLWRLNVPSPVVDCTIPVRGSPGNCTVSGGAIDSVARWEFVGGGGGRHVHGSR